MKAEEDATKRYKARLVINSFEQREGMDYSKVFASVMKMTIIWLVLSFVVAQDCDLELVDVKTTFFHGELKENICLHQLEGYEILGKENIVCRLQKSLYGLKKAPL